VIGLESVVLDGRKVTKMSHTVVVEFPCAEGKGAQFLEALRGALPDTRDFEGCELVETYTHQDDPDKILLWEKWAAKPNQEAYLNWRAETGMLDLIGPFLAGAPSFIHLDHHADV